MTLRLFPARLAVHL